MDCIRVLVVEDEYIVGEDLRGALQDLGYQVSILVTSGEEAIKRAGEERPDIILMDIVLTGEIDGIGAADEIRNRFNIPVIFLTAYTDKKTIDQAKRIYPFEYLIKPFEPRELHSTIEIVLNKAHMEQKLREAAEEREKLIEKPQAAKS